MFSLSGAKGKLRAPMKGINWLAFVSPPVRGVLVTGRESEKKGRLGER